MTHTLKTWPTFFALVFEGIKNFEYRINDRNFKVGDVLFLKEYDPIKEQFTGRSVKRHVTFILSDDNSGWPLHGWCIMSLR